MSPVFRQHSWLLAALYPICVAGCGDGPSATYYRDVVPILARSCLPCHSAEGIAPFPLETYEQVADLAPFVESVVAQRIMPPATVDNSGSCQTYRNARWLDDDEIGVIVEWVAADAPAGATQIGPPPAILPAARLGTEAVELDPGEPYLPADGVVDELHCFLVDPRLPQDSFMTAFSVEAGQPDMVHHVILYSLPTDEAEAQAERLDEEAEGPGYPCLGDPKVPYNILGVWQPGGPPAFYPAGAGVRVPGQRQMIMRVHYALPAAPRPDRSVIRLAVSEQVEHEVHIAFLADYDMRLEPGRQDLRHEVVHDLGERMAGADRGQILAVMPHMHNHGRQMRIWVEDGEATTCVAETPRWDFDWQDFYFLDHPITVTDQARIHVECQYDTRGVTEPLIHGERASDEMCVAVIALML